MWDHRSTQENTTPITNWAEIKLKEAVSTAMHVLSQSKMGIPTWSKI
jgi:hypothetical protein